MEAYRLEGHIRAEYLGSQFTEQVTERGTEETPSFVSTSNSRWTRSSKGLTDLRGGDVRTEVATPRHKRVTKYPMEKTSGHPSD